MLFHLFSIGLTIGKGTVFTVFNYSVTRFVRLKVNRSRLIALDLLKLKIEKLSITERNKVARLALSYPPATRALLGALLEVVSSRNASEKLYKSLNPLSKYALGIKESVLPNKDKWKIV